MALSDSQAFGDEQSLPGELDARLLLVSPVGSSLPLRPRGRPESTIGDGLHVVRSSRINSHPWIVAIIAADLCGAVFLATLIFWSQSDVRSYDRAQLWAGFAGFVMAWGIASHSQELYRRKVVFGSRRQLLQRALVTCLLAFGLIITLAFGLGLHGGVSRLCVIAWVGSATCVVLLGRMVFLRHLAAAIARGCCVSRGLVLCGSTSSGETLRQAIEGQSRSYIRIVGIGLFPGLFSAPSFAAIEEKIRDGSIDRVFIAAYDGYVAEANAVLSRLARFSVDVSVLPDLQGLRAPPVRVGHIGTLPVVDVSVGPLTPIQAGLKRLEDVAVAAIALFTMLPVMVLIAAAIKLDSPGPIFYRQLRAGFHDRTFLVCKFRTMRHQAQTDGPLQQTCRHDRRVTALGGWLRRTSLDELPQLWNVIRGEMSIVGPRPHAVTMTTAGLPLHVLLPDYGARHRIKPGITGWAQVNGSRGQVITEDALRQRIAFDLHYIENWSLALDAWIILRTLGVILFDRSAY